MALSIHAIIKLCPICVQGTVSGAGTRRQPLTSMRKVNYANILGFLERIPGRLSSRDHLFRRMFGDNICVLMKKRTKGAVGRNQLKDSYR